MFFQRSFVMLLLSSAALASHARGLLRSRQSPTKVVAAHFIVGIVSRYTASDWQIDIAAAQDMGIDSFALNIGNADTHTPFQLALAYSTAQSMGFKMFISFDFAYFGDNGDAMIVDLLKTYAGHPAALQYDGGAVVSTFIGDSFGNKWNTVRAEVQTQLTLLPNWQPATVQNSDFIDGAFSWIAWPNSNNQPIPGPLTTDADESYVSALQGRAYMSPVSPWFFTHFGSKNWIFASDDLYVTRWNQILSLQPELLQLVTWNDFGESSYVGPLGTGHDNDGSGQWVNEFPHDAWRALGKPFISAYKSGSSAPVITSEKLIYWYRPHSKSLTCTEDSLPRPNGWDYAQDKVFVATILTSPAQLVITSGSGTPAVIDVSAGVVLSSAEMGVGAQVFTLRRDGCDIISGMGGRQVSGSCETYNFNAYVGELLPDGQSCSPLTSTSIFRTSTSVVETSTSTTKASTSTTEISTSITGSTISSSTTDPGTTSSSITASSTTRSSPSTESSATTGPPTITTTAGSTASSIISSPNVTSTKSSTASQRRTTTSGATGSSRRTSDLTRSTASSRRPTTSRLVTTTKSTPVSRMPITSKRSTTTKRTTSATTKKTSCHTAKRTINTNPPKKTSYKATKHSITTRKLFRTSTRRAVVAPTKCTKQISKGSSAPIKYHKNN